MLHWLAEGRHVLVVGGGTVALQKARAATDAGAIVTVVAPRILDALQAHTRHMRPFEPADLDGMDLVFAATDDPSVNRTVAALCRARRLLVNVADDPEACDVTLPAVVRRGDLVLAVSTSGQSPGFAAWLRGDLEQRYGPEYGRALAVAARLRQEARLSGEDPRTLPYAALVAEQSVP